MLLLSVTKWPKPGQAPIKPPVPPNHAGALTEVNKKHYEPVSWDKYFDELTYTDNVHLFLS